MTTKYNPFYRTEPKLIYVPERWGRLDQGEWVADSQFNPPPKPTSREYLDARNLFRIAHSISDGGANDRTDVGKLEALLYMAGVFDLDRTNGPTGYYGERLNLAVREFQKSQGLAIDGAVRPDGETIHTLARTLQGLGRRGDTVLAHITPEEARFLHENTDGGSINPATGLMEFNQGGGKDKKEGTYIWRTAGDDKVRPSHAERDGEVFSWDDPPDGGHPGEAPNCRCTAEEVKDEAKCKELETKIERAEVEVKALKNELKLARKILRQHEREFIESEDELFDLLSPIGLSDLFDGGGDFLQRLKRALGRLNLTALFGEIAEAWERRRTAKRNMEIARENLMEAEKNLKAAEKELSRLREEHEKNCR